MASPGFSDFFLMLFDQSSNPSKIHIRQSGALCQLDPGLEPELRLSAFAPDMDVNPVFFAREEKEAKARRTKNRRAQTRIASIRTGLSRAPEPRPGTDQWLLKTENRPDFE